jgi:inorganic phosphate transporter, PiT family
MSTLFTDLRHIIQNPYVALIFFTALVFDFINGFHDSANSIATVIGTRVLRPLQAVVWAAWWNFLAAWAGGLHVANAVATWVHVEYVTVEVIFAGLLGAIVWNLITWYGGLPSSSSHALLGGFAGAAIVHARTWSGVLQTAKVISTVEFIVIAPLVGLALGLLFTFIVLWACRKVTPIKMDRGFRIVQLGSAAAYSLGHGMNDAQKTMGIIAALLYASIWKKPTGRVRRRQGNTSRFGSCLVCNLAIALGTHGGRLADCENDEHENHQAAALQWRLRRTGGGGVAVHVDGNGYSR